MQGKQPRFTRRLLMMMKDAQDLPFVGPAASFLLTQAPLISGAYTKLREREAFVQKVKERFAEEAQLDAINERLEAKIDKGVSDLFDEAQKKAALSTPKVETQDTHHPDYAALLADVATAATRFLELAGPHLAKIEGEDNWQQVLDANMAVAFALERAVVAVARSMQGSLASEPPGPCAEQPFRSIESEFSNLHLATLAAIWGGFCEGKPPVSTWGLLCTGLLYDMCEGQMCTGLTAWTEEPGMWMDPASVREELKTEGVEIDASDWLSGEDK